MCTGRDRSEHVWWTARSCELQSTSSWWSRGVKKYVISGTTRRRLSAAAAAICHTSTAALSVRCAALCRMTLTCTQVHKIISMIYKTPKSEWTESGRVDGRIIIIIIIMNVIVPCLHRWRQTVHYNVYSCRNKWVLRALRKAGAEWRFLMWEGIWFQILGPQTEKARFPNWSNKSCVSSGGTSGFCGVQLHHVTEICRPALMMHIGLLRLVRSRIFKFSLERAKRSFYRSANIIFQYLVDQRPRKSLCN